jgi:hypothetical protein
MNRLGLYQASLGSPAANKKHAYAMWSAADANLLLVSKPAWTEASLNLRVCSGLAPRDMARLARIRAGG